MSMGNFFVLITGRFLVLDIGVLANAIQSTSGIRISGIIGSDIMKRYGESRQGHFFDRYPE